MKASRRAVPDDARSGTVVAVRSTVVALATAFISATGLLALLAGRVARRVVTPGGRAPDTSIVDVDTAAQTITLSRSADTVLPGRYGLFTTGTQSYVKVGTVLSTRAQSVTRKLLTQIDESDRITSAAAFSGWYFSEPGELHLPFEDVAVSTSLGSCPAWVFPADVPTDLWAIHIHGRGTTRSETLRGVPAFHAAGITSMLTSYRNDGDAPRSRGGASALGATEWRDIDRAIGHARRSGARRIVLVGWSMGGAIALQLAVNSAHRDRIVGLVLDSPVVDWRQVLTHHAGLMGIPNPLTRAALEALAQRWAAPLTGAADPIPWDRLDVLTRADELVAPTLILHSDADDFVPVGASRALRDLRPELVDLEEFEGARHTKLWNYDEERWTSRIRDWLVAQGLSGDGASGS
ncbi:alpha/beta hydrolase family protein [Microbacterium oleivorans]|uniref:alpha/beta hydrolase family protein n=1 Tax=Microbacterium oleivorans TaxID=273677 RepID=UPI00080E47CD|nr:alpha/beta fold hydrolase [Microbacterium oleivorans]